MDTPMNTPTSIAYSTPTAQANQAALQRVILADAVFSATSAMYFWLASEPLGEFLGASPAVMTALTVFQFAYALLLAYQLTRPVISRGFALFIAAGNSAWVLASLLLLVLPVFSFTSEARWAIGVAALCVDLFATLQFVMWRRMR